MSIENLDKIFHPKSIAVVGASEREGSIGGMVIISAGGKESGTAVKNVEASNAMASCSLCGTAVALYILKHRASSEAFENLS